MLDAVGLEWRGDPRERSWLDTVDAIAAWREEHGGWPRRVSSSAEEARLYRWLTNRRREARGLGSGAAKFARDGRADLLDDRLPGWDSETNDARWESQAAACGRFFDVNGWVPRNGGRDGEESALARWLAVQRAALDEGTPRGAARVARLDALLPGWRAPGLDEWLAVLDRVCDFHAAHGRLPRRYTGDQAEETLYGWLARQREYQARGATLFVAQGRGKLLDARLPGWAITQKRRGAPAAAKNHA